MASYRSAVEWIALNDDAGNGAGEDTEGKAAELREVHGLVSVALVADLWGKDRSEVARAVIRARRREERARSSVKVPRRVAGRCVRVSPFGVECQGCEACGFAGGR